MLRFALTVLAAQAAFVAAGPIAEAPVENSNAIEVRAEVWNETAVDIKKRDYGTWFNFYNANSGCRGETGHRFIEPGNGCVNLGIHGMVGFERGCSVTIWAGGACNGPGWNYPPQGDSSSVCDATIPDTNWYIQSAQIWC